MTEHPILFSTEMVRAIREGRKTQTRRVIKKEAGKEYPDDPGATWQFCPYGYKGDRLWIRETWCENRAGGYDYKASVHEEYHKDFTWRPSIYMPRKACRILLNITNVRVERLHQITASDVLAEGIPQDLIDHWKQWLNPHDAPGHAFSILWDKINGKKYPWSSNPWVWVLEFERLKNDATKS